MPSLLLTGMTSRQANPRVSPQDVTFTHLLAEAYRQAGWEVEHRNPSLQEDVSHFDRVIVGISPLHALGSNRVYGALSAIMRTWPTGKLYLLIDDPDTGKIFSGIRTMVENPQRLTKPFFAYKLEHALASSSTWKEWLEEGVKLLKASTWPPVIVPQNAWAGTPTLAGAGHQVPEILGVDPTALLPYGSVFVGERRPVWVTEARENDPWLNSVKPFISKEIERHGSGALPRYANDMQRVDEYSGTHGVLVPPVLGGTWWQSRPGIASECGAVVLTDWRTVRPLGKSWTLTPEQADQLSPTDRDKVTEDQYNALRDTVPSADSIVTLLEGTRTHAVR